MKCTEHTQTYIVTRLEGFTIFMSRNRFSNLLTFIHAADSKSPQAATNPGQKTDTRSQMLLSNWPAYYNPHREISVDETFVPFKGRTKLLKYIPSKPRK